MGPWLHLTGILTIVGWTRRFSLQRRHEAQQVTDTPPSLAINHYHLPGTILNLLQPGFELKRPACPAGVDPSGCFSHIHGAICRGLAAPVRQPKWHPSTSRDLRKCTPHTTTHPNVSVFTTVSMIEQTCRLWPCKRALRQCCVWLLLPAPGQSLPCTSSWQKVPPQQAWPEPLLGQHRCCHSGIQHYFSFTALHLSLFSHISTVTCWHNTDCQVLADSYLLLLPGSSSLSQARCRLWERQCGHNTSLACRLWILIYAHLNCAIVEVELAYRW